MAKFTKGIVQRRIVEDRVDSKLRRRTVELGCYTPDGARGRNEKIVARAWIEWIKALVVSGLGEGV